MAVHHVNKGIAALSLVLGTLVLLISMWTFGSIVYREQHNETDSKADSFHANENLFKDDLENSPKNVTEKHEISSKFWARFEHMPHLFKEIIIGCAWITLIAAALQISSSLFILFSSPKNVLNRSKYLVAVHFPAFVILLGTFLTPVAYDREHEHFYTMTSFNTKVKNGFKQLEEEGITHFLLTDLHAYYSIIFIDSFSLFFIMITISCLLGFYNNPKTDFDDRYQ